MNLLEAEAGRGNCDYDAVGELRELRAHFEVSFSIMGAQGPFRIYFYSIQGAQGPF